MKERKTLDRLKRWTFSEQDRPLADAILRERGVDGENSVALLDEKLKPVIQKPWKPWLLPILFGVFAGGMAGRHIGAAIAGALGAGLVAGVLAWVGWWVGAKLALQISKLQSKPLRFIVGVIALFAWIFVVGVAGILAQIGAGRVFP